MSTYNAYFNKNVQVGKITPVWLGVVSPIPVGAVLDADYAYAGAFYPAGTPMALGSDGRTAKPLLGFEVISYTTSSTNSLITVKGTIPGLAPKATDVLQKVGATFAATGKAWLPSAIEAGSVAGTYVITVATSGIDVVAAGDMLTYSASSDAGSSKSIAVKPEYYLYNDVAIDPVGNNQSMSNVQASVALVNFHGEGILIKRTPAAACATAMKAAVPNVYQEVRY